MTVQTEARDIMSAICRQNGAALRAGDAAAKLNISRRTLYHWADDPANHRVYIVRNGKTRRFYIPPEEFRS